MVSHSARASPEERGDAEQHDEHGVVDVEAVGNERQDAHRTHNLEQRRKTSRDPITFHRAMACTHTPSGNCTAQFKAT